jgi:hypothetical protein
MSARKEPKSFELVAYLRRYESSLLIGYKPFFGNIGITESILSTYLSILGFGIFNQPGILDLAAKIENCLNKSREIEFYRERGRDFHYAIKQTWFKKVNFFFKRGKEYFG